MFSLSDIIISLVRLLMGLLRSVRPPYVVDCSQDARRSNGPVKMRYASPWDKSVMESTTVTTNQMNQNAALPPA